MGMPAAKQGDQITATDTHIVQPPGSSPPVAVSLPFAGIIDGALSSNVNIMSLPAATKDSTATNMPPHVPPGGTFVKPPSNKGTIQVGSATVNINGRPAARNGDTATTCNDPQDLPVGQVVAAGTVNIG
jgi:uncharacterized Zn-binding protein involved in type VI secretion